MKCAGCSATSSTKPPSPRMSAWPKHRPRACQSSPMTRRARGPGPIRRWRRRSTVPDKQRRDIGSLISDVSGDIQPIKRGGGLSGLIGGQHAPAEAGERAQAPDAPPPRAEETTAPARGGEPAQPSASPAPRERRAPATRVPRAAGERRSEVAASTSRSTQRAIGTVRRRESAEESVTRQNKTFRLLPELARD